MSNQKKDQKILIMEDEEVLVKLYKELLVNIGYEVDTAMDGEEALEKLRQNYYDLITVDIVMPKLDGLSVMRKMNEEGIKQGKVIILSALNQEDIIRVALKLGATRYLAKYNTNPKDLPNIVDKTLNTTT